MNPMIQLKPAKAKPVMQCNFRIKNVSLAAIIGCVALLSVVPLEAQQPISPTGTLEVAPATVVNAQPNYVMEQPVFPREIPFRPTMDRAAYDAAKAQANFYGPRAAKPSTETLAPLAPPVLRQINFNGHSSTDGFRPPDTHGGGHHSFCRSNQQPYRHVDKTEHRTLAFSKKRDPRDLLRLHHGNALRSACGL